MSNSIEAITVRPKSPSVTDAELAVLQLLWKNEAMTVRALTQQLYPPETSSGVATVQKLLQRLEVKHLVVRDRNHHAHHFSASVSQSEFAGEQLSDMARKLSEGSLAPLLVHLFESNQLTPSELADIRRLLDGHQQSSSREGSS
ncbi:BlaI/MecI/CopY family transcriptional regulator [Symmachiella dynata]|uniref:BlaI/MecI/CopY family transcriptional regulator n=1 Tax=Symmachiella dynata TaxID=2527995 RepID=UPI001E628763|nr:BlaI/MecI/CopY family transcriptional regulator [Symmachiella dynata]